MIDYSILINSFQRGIMEGAMTAAAVVGQAAAELWSNYSWLVIIVAVVFFSNKYLHRGIGSVLYYLFYFSIFAVIIWIYGWEIIFNSYFELIYFLVYKFSFHLVGLILKEIRHNKYSYNY